MLHIKYELGFAPSTAPSPSSCWRCSVAPTGFWTTYYVEIMVDSEKMRKYTFKKVTLTTICA